MVDFMGMQKKWQDAWQKSRLFEAEKSDDEKFFITIPYPYISGSLHIGHARVVTEADVYARFQRMLGKNVLFPIAFHISGTPVLGISLAIKNNDKEKIELYRGYVRNYIDDEKEVEKIVASFAEPQKIVDFFIPKMKDEFSTLGLSVDWRRSFTSGDTEHQKLVEWQFRKYKKLGYLIQGKYPILYSTELGNAVGEDDIVEGDVDPVEKQEFVMVKFGYNDSFLVAATLRPETLFGQTNLWVNPDMTYVLAKVSKEKWIVSSECLEKLKMQDFEVAEISNIKGKDLLGKMCSAPFMEKEIIILPSVHCDPDRGTGIVTSVPSDAPFDWISLKILQDSPELCKRYGLIYEKIKKIKPIPIITSKGYGECPAVDACTQKGISSLEKKELAEATQEIYKAGFHTGIMKEHCGRFSGMATAHAREEMKKELLEKKKGSVIFETSRPAKARDGSKVIVAMLDNQWFLDFNAKGWKEKAHDALKHVELVPEKYRKQFEDTFVWLDKRPCARRRGLGTRLPFDTQWVIESLSDSTMYMALYPICHKLRKYKPALNEAFFDYVLIGEGDVNDIAKQCNITKKMLEELHDEFDYWYPFDHRHTFTAHLSNHLTFMLFAHAALFKKDKWPRKITFHGMVISEGMKMSKSKGNVVTLLEVNQKYGADAFRAFMCYSTSVDSSFNWETNEVEKMKAHLASLYVLIGGMITHRAKEARAPAFESRVERHIEKATEHLNAMKLREYATIVLFDLVNLHKKAVRKLSREELGAFNSYLLDKWLLMLAPLAPHMAEDLWKLAGHKGFISTEKWMTADKERIDYIAEYKEDFADKVEEDIRTVCNLAKIEHPKEIILFVAEHWKGDLVAMLKELMKDSHEYKTLLNAVMKTELKKKGEDVAKIIPGYIKDPSRIPSIVLGHDTELEVLQKALDNLEKMFGCHVKVMNAEKTTEQKARAALPGKPAILVK